jgi:hypothetical protein
VPSSTPGPGPAPATGPSDDPSGTATGSGDSRPDGGRRAGRWTTLAVGLVVGGLAWLAGEAAERAFPARREWATNRLGVRTLGVTPRTAADAGIRNVALSSGLFGGLLGAALGAAGALGRRPAAVAVRRAALFGLGLGGVAGSGMALAIVPLYYRRFAILQPEGLVPPLLMHAGIWGAIGAAAGLAFGLGRAGRGPAAVKALLGGLAGAVLGAVLYEVIGALAFPMSRTFQPTAADWPPRLLARLLVAGFAALGTFWPDDKVTR